MADPRRPGLFERKALLIALGVIVIVTAIYLGMRMLSPDPAPDTTHGGPDPEHSAPQTVPQTMPPTTIEGADQPPRQ